MATAMGRMSVTDYEHQRNARLDENRKRMEALGLLNLSRSLAETNASDASQARKKVKGRGGSSVTTAAVVPACLPRRRSSRLVGNAPPSYNESRVIKDDPEVLDARQREPEIYTEEHEKLLGNCEEDWELFIDGFRPDGTRIYDSCNGKTCHQCRQKTMGLRTTCSQCQSLRGQFCGDCLFMRYGENVCESLKNDKWVCPVCRGICNCSNCRIRKGWAPTGSMYRVALKLNYKSVAHYLIMTRRENPVEGGENKQGSKVLDNEKLGAADDCENLESPETGKGEHEEDEYNIEVVIDHEDADVEELSTNKGTMDKENVDIHKRDVNGTVVSNPQSSEPSNTDTTVSEVTTDEVEDGLDSKPTKRRGRPKGSAKNVQPEGKQSETTADLTESEVTTDYCKPVENGLETKPVRRPGRPKGCHSQNENVESKSGKKRGQNVRTPVPTRRSLRSKSTEKVKTESGDTEEKPIKMKKLDMEVEDGCEEEETGEDNVSENIDDSLCPRRSLKYVQ